MSDSETEAIVFFSYNVVTHQNEIKIFQFVPQSQEFLSGNVKKCSE